MIETVETWPLDDDVILTIIHLRPPPRENNHFTSIAGALTSSATAPAPKIRVDEIDQTAIRSRANPIEMSLRASAAGGWCVCDGRAAPQALISIEFPQAVIGLADYHRYSADRAAFWRRRLLIGIHKATSCRATALSA
jgi:hypothetical protein